MQQVTRALCRKANQFIKWPGIEAQNKLKEKFYQIAGEIIEVLPVTFEK